MWRPRPSLLTLLLLSPWGLLSRPAYAQSSGGEHLLKSCEETKPALVKDIAEGCVGTQCAGSVPTGMVDMGGVLYFQASDGGQGLGRYGSELWRSDGTPAGTWLVKDIAENPDDPNSDPRELTVVHGTLFFVATQNGKPTLWKSNGTRESTQFVHNLDSNEAEMELTALGNRLIFKMKGQGGSTKLWRSDGSAGGTVEVAAANGVNYSNPQFLTPLGDGRIYFQAWDSSHGAELWKSDGTPEGTLQVKDLWPGGDGAPSDLTVANEQLFFRAINTPGGNYKLWKSSGSPENTELVLGITGDGPLEDLTAAGDLLFFTIRDGQTVLWVYRDGWGARNLRSFSSPLSQLTHVSGLLFFMHNNELWKSDGTKSGTQLVKNFDTTPISLMAPGPGMAILVADDPEGGYSLWKSNGQPTGTLKMARYPYQAGIPSPTTTIVSALNKLFFVATEYKDNKPFVGDELFSVDFNQVDCTPPEVTCAGPMTVEALSPGGAQVQFLPPKSISDDSLLPVKEPEYTPASGTRLPWSQTSPTPVTVTVKDGVGNPGTCTMEVFVRDSTAPWIQCPPERLYAEATAMEGAPVFFQVSANDAVVLDRVELSAPSGSFFPLGETQVKATAVDGANNRSECTFWVDVKDRMPPSIECPGPQTVAVQGEDGGRVEFAEASAQDNAGSPEVRYSPEQGSVFPVGETVVTATATDAEGNTVSCTFPVTVTGGGSEGEGEGCGCRSGGVAGSVVWLLLVLFPAWTRRRAGKLGA
ncbi:HYR domain-containing protein [Stigmatella hybrida]|uniref:HYR domain-containing protein n=1 Tax=Stigmatella hybrida TaxID=394097 RepID=UPI001CDB03EB|nr:HYR domain-containing protein [Stigmatella hybrida]